MVVKAVVLGQTGSHVVVAAGLAATAGGEAARRATPARRRRPDAEEHGRDDPYSACPSKPSDPPIATPPIDSGRRASEGGWIRTSQRARATSSVAAVRDRDVTDSDGAAAFL